MSFQVIHLHRWFSYRIVVIASSSYRRVIYCSYHYISVIDFDMQIFVELSEKTVFVAGAMKKHELEKVS